jgi:uncharacterized membrane protein SpoIIM required for sporulation
VLSGIAQLHRLPCLAILADAGLRLATGVFRQLTRTNASNHVVSNRANLGNLAISLSTSAISPSTSPKSSASGFLHFAQVVLMVWLFILGCVLLTGVPLAPGCHCHHPYRVVVTGDSHRIVTGDKVVTER